MNNDNFRIEAKNALDLNAEGINLLIEVSELQDSLKNSRTPELTLQIVKEIIAKEKQAVGLIQRSTQIQRQLMQLQHAAIEHLTGSL